VGKLLSHHKVFGIGLSKTGTTSLAVALNVLGISTIHYPCDERTYEELIAGDYRLSVLNEFQGVVDTPVAPYYAQLDKIYPGSKFVLTVRKKDSWLRSCREHWEFEEWWMDRFLLNKTFWQFISAVVYGVHRFNEERFSYVYDLHVKNVMEYFADRTTDFMVMDICKGEGWERLCLFLGLPKPSVPFPHSNKFQDRDSAGTWAAQVGQAIDELISLVPDGSKFILVDEDQWVLSTIGGRKAIPFLERNWLYWGPPPDDKTAIREV
jgi:hypothetical protein